MWGVGERSLARVRALDGLRGLAVAGVLLYHAGFDWARGGFLGVSIFFTLSGFLITSLLLAERDGAGRISLRHFWSRRARRILPAALLALGGVALYGLTVADASQAGRLPGDGLSALAEVANWRFVFGDQSYAALFLTPSPVQHFWSLAIEEQFYVVFPLVVVAALAASKGTRRGLTAVVVLLGAGSVGLSLLLFTPGEDPSRVYYGTDTRAVELLAGALLALLLTNRRRLERPAVQRITALAGVLALGGLVTAWVAISQADARLYQGGLALHAALVALVIAAALVPGPVRAALGTAPFVALGLVSYGAYLYHWPIYLWLDADRTGLDGAALFAVRLAVTLAVAALSWYFVEQPIRHGRRVTGWRPAVVVPAAAAVVAVLLVTLPSSSEQPRIVFEAVRGPATALAASRPSAAGAARLPVTGPRTAVAADEQAAPAAPIRPPVRKILVVGDSVAQTLGRGLERWGPRHGVRVVNGARFYCGIARGGRLGALLGRSNASCGDWAPAWSRLLDRTRPDVVVVLSTMWDLGSRQRDEWGPDFVSQGDPRFDSFVTAEWGQAAELLGSRGARVVWLTNPCAEIPQLSNDLRYANDRYLPVLTRFHPVVQIDLRARVCPAGAFSNRLGPVDGARPDGVHFSDPGADWVASWLGPLLADPELSSDDPPSVPVKRA
jgi:peptidoglycan/LPS O-acetylase OafA/YrhL